jgi:hypothetical protein
MPGTETPDRRQQAGWFVLAVIMGAIWPRTWHREHPSRLTPGLVLRRFAAAALVQLLRPALARHLERRERVRADLTKRLGREPTDEELYEAL